MIEKTARNMDEFVSVVNDAVQRAESNGWPVLDLTIGGNCVALKVHYGLYSYRLNANNKLMAVTEFLRDFKQHGFGVVSSTVASGYKIDSGNRAHSPRKGLYLYRNGG